MTGKAFIWDLDGTLLDSYGVIVSSLCQTLEELGLSMDAGEIRRQATEGSVSQVIQRAAAETGRLWRPPPPWARSTLSTPTGAAPRLRF